MNENERKALMVELLNRFAKCQTNLNELIQFGTNFIINAANLTGFPKNRMNVILEEVHDQLKEGLETVLKDDEA